MTDLPIIFPLPWCARLGGRKTPAPGGPRSARETSARQPEPLAAVGAAHDALPPAPVVEVPAHGLAQTVLEIVPRPPAEFVLDFAGVDGVTRIMARPVGDGREQLFMRAIHAVVQQL